MPVTKKREISLHPTQPILREHLQQTKAWVQEALEDKDYQDRDNVEQGVLRGGGVNSPNNAQKWHLQNVQVGPDCAKLLGE